MSVEANRSGGTAVVTITVDVSDILAGEGTAQEKRLNAYDRARLELEAAITATHQDDAALDARVAEVTAEVANIKAKRPTGTL